MLRRMAPEAHRSELRKGRLAEYGRSLRPYRDQRCEGVDDGDVGVDFNGLAVEDRGA